MTVMQSQNIPANLFALQLRAHFYFSKAKR
jgi:hypothetical protein